MKLTPSQAESFELLYSSISNALIYAEDLKESLPQSIYPFIVKLTWMKTNLELKIPEHLRRLAREQDTLYFDELCRCVTGMNEEQRQRLETFINKQLQAQIKNNGRKRQVIALPIQKISKKPFKLLYKKQIMAQQTAIEWLYNELTKTWYDKKSSEELLEQAKKMEKKQIIDAYEWGLIDGAKDEEKGYYNGKDFYNGYYIES